MGILSSILGNSFSDPLKVFTPKDRGGMGMPDPLNLYDSQASPLATPAAPDMTPPPSLVTPTAIATDSDKRDAARKMMASQLARKGRASTILTDTLGASG